MPTDQFAGAGRGREVAPLSRPSFARAPERRLLAWLAWGWMHRRRRHSLDDFSDHLLADIGLRREAGTLRGPRAPDPWFLGQDRR